MWQSYFVILFPAVLSFLIAAILKKFKKSALIDSILALLLGMCSAGIAFGLSHLADLGGQKVLQAFWEWIFYAFVAVAFAEEIAKWLLFVVLERFRKLVQKPSDAILYCFLIAMGFATVENSIYLIENGTYTGFLRLFTAIPAHAVFGILMGYYYGLAKFVKKQKVINYIKSVFWPVFFHGCYDFFFIQEWNDYILFLAFAVLALGIYLSIKAIWQIREVEKKMSYD